MPRGKRTIRNPEDTQAPAPRRGRRRKAIQETEPVPAPVPAMPPETVVEDRDPALVAAEAALIQKYPDRKIKPGSLQPAGAVPEFGHKRTLILECSDCGAERRLATSDLFHVSRCVDCAKQARRKAARKNEGEN